jgi:hypothetical protein
MLIERCNRCGRDAQYSHYKFKIEEHVLTGSMWEDFCTPETRLDDLHFCPICMREFVDFIKEKKMTKFSEMINNDSASK